MTGPIHPFWNKRSSDFANIPRPTHLPPAAGLAARAPDYIGHLNDLYEKLYLAPMNALEANEAIAEESARLPFGRYETREVWVHNHRSGYPDTGPTVILTDPRISNLLPPGRKRFELTPMVTVGRLPTPLPENRFLSDRSARDATEFAGWVRRQSEHDRQHLAYDRVRSLLTDAGPDAATSSLSTAEHMGIAAEPMPRRGLQVYPAPIGPMPASDVVLPSGWHPPMSLPESTPLP